MFLITTNIYKNIYNSSFAIESNITGIIINLFQIFYQILNVVQKYMLYAL
jgi:hypothetical protein